MSDSFSQLPGRAKFAAAGAGLAVQNQFKSQGSRGSGPSIIFSALMLLALTIAITAIVAWRFTPTKAASGASGRSSTWAKAGSRPTSARLG